MSVAMGMLAETRLFSSLRQVYASMCGSLALLWYALSRLSLLRKGPIKAVFHRQLYFTGVEALGIVAVFALLCGTLVVTQVTSLVGGDSALTVKILIWTVVREVGPLFAAIVIMARSSAAIASELALMKIHGEMDSLLRMRILPEDYLVIPRIAGVTLAVLALTVYFQAIAVGGGLAISAMFQNVSYEEQVGRFMEAVQMSEFFWVVIKGCLFGLVISTSACYSGMHAQLTLTDVPRVAIKSVLQSLLLVFLLDAVIAYLGMIE